VIESTTKRSRSNRKPILLGVVLLVGIAISLLSLSYEAGSFMPEFLVGVFEF
jgi:hypothetical protein